VYFQVKTKEDGQSHLRLQTTRRDPFSDWVTSVDELFRGRSPFESMLSIFDPFRTGFGSIQIYSESFLVVLRMMRKENSTEVSRHSM